MDINHLKTKCAGVQPPLAYINRAHVASLTRGLHFKKIFICIIFFLEQETNLCYRDACF